MSFNLGGGGGDPWPPDEPEQPTIRPYSDPFTGHTIDIVDGEVLIAFKNRPMFAIGVDPNAFDEEPFSVSPIGDQRVVGVQEVDDFVQQTGITVDAEWPALRGIGAKLPVGTTVEYAVQNWPSQYPDLVESVWPNDLISACITVPNDPQFPRQWGLREFSENEPSYGADAWDAWDDPNGRGRDDIYVAVVDTGVYRWHGDLVGRIDPYGIDVRRDPWHTPPADFYYPFWRLNGGVPPVSFTFGNAIHGTQVTGVVTANTNNGVYVAGASWNTKILPVGAFTILYGNELRLSRKAEIVALYEVGVAKGMYPDLFSSFDGYPGTHFNIEAVNCSFGGGGRDDLEAEVLWDLSHFMVVVAAAGNGNMEITAPSGANPIYPASWFWAPPGQQAKDFVLTVMAHNQAGYRANLPFWPFSNWGSPVEVSAPGSNIVVLWYTDPGYTTAAGTSVAAPFVTATAAILAAKSKALVPNVSQRITPDQIVNNIKTYMRKYAIRDPATIPGYLNIGGSVFGYNP